MSRIHDMLARTSGKNPFVDAASDLARDSRGQLNFTNRVIGVIIALAVGGLLAAFLLPVALDELYNVSTTDWDSGAASIWGVIGIIIVVVLFLAFLRPVMGGMRSR